MLPYISTDPRTRADYLIGVSDDFVAWQRRQAKKKAVRPAVRQNERTAPDLPVWPSRRGFFRRAVATVVAVLAAHKAAR